VAGKGREGRAAKKMGARERRKKEGK